MDTLTKAERQAIRSLMQDGRFTAVGHYLRILKDKYKDEQVKSDTEFETTWRTAQREAKVECIDNIINGLMEEASNDD